MIEYKSECYEWYMSVVSYVTRCNVPHVRTCPRRKRNLQPRRERSSVPSSRVQDRVLLTMELGLVRVGNRENK